MNGSGAPDKKPAGVQGSLLAFEDAKASAASALGGLSEMQRKYAEARLSGMIPLHAAQAAGYSTPEVNAYRVEKHPAVQKALINARKMVIEKFDVNREDVLRGMFDAVQASGNATELVAAWREIGRIIGAYEPAKVEIMHRLEDVTLDRLQRLSTKELIELAEGKDFVVETENDPLESEYRALSDSLTRPWIPYRDQPRANRDPVDESDSGDESEWEPDRDDPTLDRQDV